jgi:hypothetical protein
MSEQEQKPKSFMQRVDEWAQATIIDPLGDCADEQLYNELVAQIKKAIREKVLDSYKNGLKAGAVAVRKEKTNEKK